jgi:hypothetical protein
MGRRSGGRRRGRRREGIYKVVKRKVMLVARQYRGQLQEDKEADETGSRHGLELWDGGKVGRWAVPNQGREGLGNIVG